MVNYSLDATFSALGDPTRRAILARLSTEGEVSIGEVAAPFDVSLPAISKHVGVLERAGLVLRRRDGRRHLLRVAPDPLVAAAAWIDRHRRFWSAQIDSLADYLEQASTSGRGATVDEVGTPSKEQPE